MKETSKDESLKKPFINIKYCNVRKFIIMDITFVIIFCFVRLIAYYICIKHNGICLDIVRAVQSRYERYFCGIYCAIYTLCILILLAIVA